MPIDVLKIHGLKWIKWKEREPNILNECEQKINRANSLRYKLGDSYPQQECKQERDS